MYYMHSPNQQIHTAHFGPHEHEVWPWVVMAILILFAVFAMLGAMYGNYVWPLFPYYPYS